ncbi:major facilitator superfamily protein [Sarocladium implicatum]|nr:major facilitator superfamily protein [Sarocladium implicatum]
MSPSPDSDDLTVVAPLAESDRSSTLSASNSTTSSDMERLQQQRSRKQIVRFVSLFFATVGALCAGSIVVFSLYAPVFQSRLHYTQFQVNGVAIGGSLALYLPVSIMGYICDRVGVQPLALLSSVLFGGGYGLAAAIFRRLDYEYNTLGKSHSEDHGWSYPLMIFAFICIGMGTCTMYIGVVSIPAKNFGKKSYRGLALGMPITGFGLSGMWLSQVASRFFTEKRPNGAEELDVFRFFAFLAILLFTMGIVGTFTLRVVDEQDLIEEAIEELEQSGLLDGASLLSRSESRYGTIDPASSNNAAEGSQLLDSSKDDNAAFKKNWVLNAETRRFLTDRTMWPFALAFLLMVGPGEAFVNNLGTVIGTLTPSTPEALKHQTSVATHVSVFGVTSTLARLLIGTLTDILAPAPYTQHVQLSSSAHLTNPAKRFAISRVVFMLFFAILLAIGLMFLASGAAQGHADRFWVVSGFVGAGYGAIFSLTPLMVNIIWGVENFATNFGIIAMLPAVGYTFWGLVYSAVYQAHARSPNGSEPGENDDVFCYGKECYAATFWAQGCAVLLGCALLFWAWLGKGGWKQRGIVI